MASLKGNGTDSLNRRIEQVLLPQVEALGYDLIEAEFQRRGSSSSLIRLYIEFPQKKGEERIIGVDDCARVDRGLTEFLESPAFEQVFSQEFTLEVSSPGIDRPLRRRDHFARFLGSPARVKTFRPLTEDEIKNNGYLERNPKQKKFAGILDGLKEDSVVLMVEGESIQIPIPLITKANLDVAHTIFDSEEKKVKG